MKHITLRTWDEPALPLTLGGRCSPQVGASRGGVVSAGDKRVAKKVAHTILPCTVGCSHISSTQGTEGAKESAPHSWLFTHFLIHYKEWENPTPHSQA